MTRPANAAELVKLRSHGQWAKWHAIIDNPDVIYTARATGPVSASGHTIGFNGGAGTLGDCLADMTLLIGSTAGGFDIGITRLRKAPTAGTFYIGIDRSIVCADDDYLTVLNDFAPFAKHPYGSCLDVDVAYSDQFSNFIPVAVWKGGRITVIEAGDTVSFDASDSWVPGSTISAYAWTFTGATSSTGTTIATPTATYNTSGRFRVKLIVTAANGKTCTSWGWVYVLGSNLAPDSGIRIESLEAETEVGWACQMVAYDRPTIKDRARVVLYSEDYFDNFKGSIGPAEDRENLLMVGWIVGETIVRDPGKEYVEFTVGGPGVYCSTIASTPAGLVDTSLPTDGGTTVPAWSKMASLSVVKGIHGLINYRSTLAAVLDVKVEDWSWPIHKIESSSDNIWDQLTDFADRAVMMLSADRYGQIFIERDANLYALADRAADIPVVMDLTDADWTNEIAIIRRQKGDIAMAEAEGYLFSGGKLTLVGGRSPGNNPGAHGDVENISEVGFLTQANALEIAGLLAGAGNGEYEQVVGIHPSNNHFMDVAPRQYVTHKIDLVSRKLIPRRITMHREAESGRVSLDLELEGEGVQWPSVAITYPDEGEAPVGPPVEPPVEPPSPPEDGELPEEPGDADAVVITGTDIRTSSDLTEATPSWTTEL